MTPEALNIGIVQLLLILAPVWCASILLVMLAKIIMKRDYGHLAILREHLNAAPLLTGFVMLFFLLGVGGMQMAVWSAIVFTVVEGGIFYHIRCQQRKLKSNEYKKHPVAG